MIIAAPSLSIARIPERIGVSEPPEETFFIEFNDGVDTGDVLYDDGVSSGNLVYA